MFQLLEKLDAPQSDKKPAESKQPKPVAKILVNKNLTNDSSHSQSFSKTKREEEAARGRTSPIKTQALEPVEPRSEARLDTQTEQDLYLAESAGIDITADSTMLREFDYNESVDMRD